MAITGKQYAEEIMKVYNLKPQAGYIYGTRGVTWTKARQDALAKNYANDPQKYSDYKLSAEKGAKWIGHVVYDCSGLTSKCGERLGLKYHHGSNSSFKYDCAYKGEKTTSTKLPVGAWVYTGSNGRRPHIGTVVDDTWVVEAQGTNAGVVRSRIDNKKWTGWGLGKGIEFDFIPGQEVSSKPVNSEPTPPQPVEKHPTIRRGSKNEYVKTLQALLNQNGSNLSVDGIFGPKTEAAVKDYQKKHGLVVDGIVGPKTWGALLG